MARQAKRVSAADRHKAKASNQQGLQQYERWEVEEAIESFQVAAKLCPTNSDYHLNLARALARSGDYDLALRALGDFIRYEKDTHLVERFEKLFANAMDGVESLLTERMTRQHIPIEQVGAAIQMWLEFRIAIGRRPLSVRKPATWASAVDYTVRKVNFRETSQKEMAASYSVSESTLRKHHNDLVETLDIMPCDYRYFRGDNNPLDKLVEAAAMVEELERRFREP